jgi:hypothetical protein
VTWWRPRLEVEDARVPRSVVVGPHSAVPAVGDVLVVAGLPNALRVEGVMDRTVFYAVLPPQDVPADAQHWRLERGRRDWRGAAEERLRRRDG